MSGDVPDGPPPLPSVFISYASADRAAARALRDCLAAAGLEVWLDEEELGGGEAWDTKLRNQIKTCTYFMPVISATTEIRREGYFRREWRLAVERTLDIADDVMFLVPVVIDDTRDAGARVPEKFFTVQWLRVPGGKETPALKELAQKLATGDTHAAPGTAVAPPAAGKTGKTGRGAEPPPPFPKFPAFPEPGHRARFVYDLVLWFGHLIHSLWGHLPRWIRVIAAMLIIFNLITCVFRDGEAARSAKKAKQTEELFDLSKALAGAGKAGGPKSHELAKTLASLVGTAAEAAQVGRPVALVTFTGDGEQNGEYAQEVFGEVCTQLEKDGPPQWGLSPQPLKPDALDAAIISRGVRLKSRFVLTGHAAVIIPGTASALTVRLFDVTANELVWKETFETATHEPEAVAQRIAAEVLKRLSAPATPPPPKTP